MGTSAPSWVTRRTPQRLEGGAAAIEKRNREGGSRLVSSRCLFFVGISLLSTLLQEVFLEATLQRRRWSLPGHTVGLIVTCGEFLGCCALSLAAGGSLWDEGSSAAGAAGASSRAQKPLGAEKREPLRAARRLLTFWRPYVALALLLFCGSGLANIAVTWVQFPVKVIIKSSKLIPTMLVSVLVGNSRAYERCEYLAALILCIGVAVFSISPGHMDAPSELVVLGVCMLLLAVLGDVAALNGQQWLMQRCEVPPMSLMLRQNITSLVITLVALLYTSQPHDIQAALVEEPMVFLHAAVFGLLTSVAVWANTNLVREAGSVTQVVFSTGRKSLTVALSYLLFPKPFTRSHGVAVCLLLMALLLQSRASCSCRAGARKSPLVAPKTNVVALRSPPDDEADPEAAIQ